MGKKNRKSAANIEAKLTEDELLDQAIRENKAAAAAAAAEAAAAVRPPTPTEVVAKLDQALLVSIVAINQGTKHPIVPGVDGIVTWYADVGDAKAALAALKAKMKPQPGLSLGLDYLPLGRAYSLSDGWTPQRFRGGTPPMTLRPSSKVLQSCGSAAIQALEAQIPAAVKQRNPQQGAFPLLYLEALQSEGVLPYFFDREDLAACWIASGRPREQLPSQAQVVDLRSLVVRMCRESTDWLARVRLVPSQSMVDLVPFVEGTGKYREALDLIAAKVTGEEIAAAAAAHAAAVASGAEPPPLV
jgi:hypothetical protein